MMQIVEPRWDESNQRWETSLGSGKNRRWFRSRKAGEEGRLIVIQKRQAFERELDGPEPMVPGCLGEFIETVWWPRAKVRCTTSTIKGYVSILEKHISRFYGYQVTSLTLEVLQPWISEIASELIETKDKTGRVVSVKPRSPKRVANIYAVMTSILELAKKTRRYPYEDHRLVELAPIPERKERTDLDSELVRKLCAAAVGSSVEGPVYVASHIGLRRNEVCGLKKSDIQLLDTHAEVTLRSNRQSHGEEQRLKSKRPGKVHCLRIPRSVGEKILSFGQHEGIYVFHDAHGKPIAPDRITKSMPELCERAGVQRVTFHDLRAACRSNLQAAGAPESMILAILNHSSISTSRKYQDRRPNDEMEMIAKLADR